MSNLQIENIETRSMTSSTKPLASIVKVLDFLRRKVQRFFSIGSFYKIQNLNKNIMAYILEN